jgi:hypothetical protein
VPIETREQANREIRKLRQKVGKLRNVVSQLKRHTAARKQLEAESDRLSECANDDASAISKILSLTTRAIAWDKDAIALKKKAHAAMHDFDASLVILRACPFGDLVAAAVDELQDQLPSTDWMEN